MAEEKVIGEAGATNDLEVVVCGLIMSSCKNWSAVIPLFVSKVLTEYVIPAAVALLVIFVGYLIGKLSIASHQCTDL